jgi:hypothetical protein
LEGDYIYLKEMFVGVVKIKKFRSRWRGPYLITKRFSDLKCQIQIGPGNYVTFNVNRLKRCHNPPVKRTSKKIVPSPQARLTDDDWSDTDDEPLSNLRRSKFIPSSQSGLQVSEIEGPGEAVTIEDTIQDGNNVNDSVIQYRSEDGPEEVELGAVTDFPSDTPDTIYNEEDAVQGNGDEVETNQLYPYDLRPLPGRRNCHPHGTIKTVLGLTGFALGQGHAPDLNQGTVFLYERDLIVPGNVWNVVVNLDLKWYRFQLDYIDVVLNHVDRYQRDPRMQIVAHYVNW